MKNQINAHVWAKKIYNVYNKFEKFITSQKFVTKEISNIIQIATVCSDAIYDIAFLISMGGRSYSLNKLEKFMNLPEYELPDFLDKKTALLFYYPDELTNKNKTRFKFNKKIRYSQLENILRNALESYGMIYALYEGFKNDNFDDVLKNFYLADIEQSKKIFSSIIYDSKAITQRAALNDFKAGLESIIQTVFPSQMVLINRNTDYEYLQSLNTIITSLKQTNWFNKDYYEKNKIVSNAVENNKTWKNEKGVEYTGGKFLYSALSQCSHNNITSIIDRVTDIHNGNLIYQINAAIANFDSTLSLAYCIIKDVLDMVKNLV